MALKTELLRGITDKEPFLDRTVFGNAVSSAVEIVEQFKSESIAVLGNDGDYLFCGKSIRDKLIECGFKADGLIYDNEADISVLIKGYAAVIAVGDSQTILRTVHACKVNGSFSVGVPIKGVFADVYTGRAICADSALTVVETGLPDKIILDDGIYKSLKKSALADGFCFICSKAGEWAQYVADCTLEGKEPSSLCKANMEKGLAVLREVKETNMHGVIFISQIYIARAVYLEPELCFGGSFYVGRAISKLKGISLYEAVNSLIAPLLKFYKFYLELERPFLVPNTNGDIERLCEILCCKEIDVYKNYSPIDFGEIESKKEKLGSKIQSVFNSGIQIVEELKDKYAEVYRGRKRRDDFNEGDFKQAVVIGGLLSKGLLKIAYDDGVCSVLNQYKN